MISKNIKVPVTLYASLASLVNLKYGNLDPDVYALVQKVNGLIAVESDAHMVTDHSTFVNIKSLVRLKYGNLDADVYKLIEEAEKLLSAETYYAVQSDSSTLTKVYNANHKLFTEFDCIEDAEDWAVVEGHILEVSVED